MKAFKRLTASLLALATAISSMSTMVSSAAETADLTGISANEAQTLATMMAEVRSSDIVYYTPYDYYNTVALAPTQHYLSVFTDGTSMASTQVRLYINTNIAGDSYSSSDHFTVGSAYSNYLSIGNITTSNYGTNRKQMLVGITVTGNPGTYAEAFRYQFDSLNVIFTEYALHQASSQSNTPTTLISEVTDTFSLQKCVYALGDVDRDGDVDSDDSSKVLSYTVNMAQVSSGRTAAEAAYDQLAFELAADFNQDDVVDIRDVLQINKYVLG